MKRLFNSVWLIVLASMLISSPIFGQDSYKAASSSTVKISGTSTIHDWEVDAEKFKADMVADTEGSTVTINDLKLSITVASIKSDKTAMDKKIYEALNSEKYPNITFTLTSPVKVDKGSIAQAKGTLSLTGVQKTITVNGKVMVDNNGNISISADYPLDMTDYDIEPPTAMFGAIKTGEEVTVHFDLKLTETAVSTGK